MHHLVFITLYVWLATLQVDQHIRLFCSTQWHHSHWRSGNQHIQDMLHSMCAQEAHTIEKTTWCGTDCTKIYCKHSYIIIAFDNHQHVQYHNLAEVLPNTIYIYHRKSKCHHVFNPEANHCHQSTTTYKMSTKLPRHWKDAPLKVSFLLQRTKTFPYHFGKIQFIYCMT